MNAFTTGQVAQQLGRPEWLIRRVADQLFDDLPRFGHKRVIAASQVAEIARAIEARRERQGAASV